MINKISPHHFIYGLHSQLREQQAVMKDGRLSHYANQFIQDHDLALYVPVRIRIDVSPYEKRKPGQTGESKRHKEWERTVAASIHFLITAHYRTFMAEGAYADTLSQVKPNQWENISNHDSCWHGEVDSRITALCWRVYDRAYVGIPQEQHPEDRTSVIDQSIGDWLLGGTPLRFARIKREYVDGYHSRLTEIKPVEFKLTFEEQQHVG